VEGKRGMYRGPICPSLILMAKSRWMRVTSGGRIAAPGPRRMARSWNGGQLKLKLGWDGILMDYVPSTANC
jgi:hypothetical protein